MHTAIETAHVAHPATGRDRLGVLDACRGFALAGIFLVNLGVFSGYVFMRPEEMAALPTATLDLPVAFLIIWLGFGKFYSLFSLLFGIGVSLQLAAAERHGDVRLRTFRRRLLALLGIGAVHMYFWEGDILFFYALMGFLLIPLRRLSNPALLRTAAALMLAPIALQTLIVFSAGRLDPGAPFLGAREAALVATGFAADTQAYPLLRDAGWLEYLRFQLSGPFFRYADLLSTGRPFKVLAMFLVGLWIGRSGMLRDLQGSVPFLRRICLWGFALGLPAAALQAGLMLRGGAPASPLKVLEATGYALGVAPLALAYAATLALLWTSVVWRSRLAVFGPAGRMALTNYLLQTGIAIALFYGIGAGLMGSVGPVWWPVIVVIVLAAQIAGSRWWLARYEFGPVEWLWRQVTYGRRLPLQRPAAPGTPL